MSAHKSASMSRDRLCAKQWFMHNGSYVDTNMSKGQHSGQWFDLERLCDGGYRFNVKNRNPVQLADTNPLIVIFSNKPPDDVYVKNVHYHRREA